MDDPLFPDPNETSGDHSLVGVFLLAFAIMLGLTIYIYSSGLWQAAGNLLLNLLGN